MSTADRSYAALLQRKKGFILASWKAENSTKGEQSPPPTDASTVMARRLGQMQYIIQNAGGGGTRTEGPCCDQPTYVYYTECATYTGPLVPGQTYIFVAQDDNALLRFRNNGVWGPWTGVPNGTSYTYVAQPGDTDYDFSCD
jgi:hypothetical protein